MAVLSILHIYFVMMLIGIYLHAQEEEDEGSILLQAIALGTMFLKEASGKVYKQIYIRLHRRANFIEGN